MGIAISNDSSVKDDIRLAHSSVLRLLNSYTKYQFTPVIDRDDTLKNDEADRLSTEAWSLFHIPFNVCHVFEILAVLILLCDGNWPTRLEMLYGIGNDEIERDDIILMVQTCISGLARVFHETVPAFDTLQELSEVIADAGFIKLEKEIDAGLTKVEFLQWAQQRFRESKTISNMATLIALCKQS